MAYVQYPEGTLWRANADGSERQQLTFLPLYTAMPRWSPDGKQIAVMGSLPGKSWQIYLMPSDGGTPEQVTNGESGYDSDPAWSADESSLAFGGSPNPSKLMLRVLDVRTPSSFPPHWLRSLWSPCWSPEGSYIAAVLGNNSAKLMLYDLRKHEQLELATANIGYQSWSHDGKFVYFETTGSDPALFRVRVHDRKIERIVSLKGLRRTMGTFAP